MTPTDLTTSLRALGMSLTSLARVLGIPLGTAQNWTRRASDKSLTPVPAWVVAWLEQAARDQREREALRPVKHEGG